MSRRTSLGVVVAAGVVAAAVLLRQGGAIPTPVPGLPDPGPVTAWGLPLLRLVTDGATIAALAGLMVAPLTMTRPADELERAALRPMHAVRRLAAVAAVAALVSVLLTYSDQFAVPPMDVRWRELRGFVATSDQATSLLVQALLLGLVAGAARWVLTNRGALVLLTLALLSLVPPLLTGHASSAGNHDTAIVGIVVHVLAAVCWVAGVGALWWHLATGRLRERALRRFSALAGWCLGLTVVSGVVSAWVRIGDLAGIASWYGAGALAKTAVLVGLGVLAARLRQGVRTGEFAGLARLTAIELTLMAVAVGLGVALGRTPPPVPDNLYTSLAESVLGGPVPPAPTLSRLLFSFTPSGVGFLVVGLGGAAYLAGVLTLRRRGDRWPIGRGIAFALGLLVVAYATFGGLGTYARVMFSAHMASHMALSMIAPILLVTGAPLQLALRALPGADVPGGLGPRQLLARALTSRPARVLLHPVTASLLLIGSLYVVYLGGLFGPLMRGHLGHVGMELHFLLAGVLFFEVLLGERPGRTLPHVARLVMLLVSMPFHAFFSIAVMGSETVIGDGYYRLIRLPYVPDRLDDQHLAGAMNWALGEVPMVLVVVLLLFQWWRTDDREARRRDRAADRDGDAELAAYNAMLERASRGSRAPRP